MSDTTIDHPATTEPAVSALKTADRSGASALLKAAMAAGGSWVTWTTLCGVGEALGAIVFAFGLAWLVADYAAGASLSDFVAPLLIGLAGVAMRAACAYARTRCGFEAGANARRWARTQVAQSISAKGPLFTESRESGALVSAMIDETEALNGYVARYGPQVRIVMLAPLLIALAAAFASWVAAAIFLVTAPLAPLFMALGGLGAAAAAKDQFEDLSRLAGRFNDRLRALPVLKAFNASQRELRGLGQAADQFRAGTMKVLRMAFLSSLFLEFFAMLSIALIAVYVGFSLLEILPFVTGESLTLREGVFVLVLAPEFYAPLRALSGAYHDRQTAMGAAERLAQFFSHGGDIARAIDPAPEGSLNDAVLNTAPDIAFREVIARYPDGRLGLNGVSFAAPAGHITALMGESGSGKSTALKVLIGFLAPQSGEVLIDGARLAAPNSLANSCAWMSQRARLFHGSIADNIRLGAPDASDEAVRQAAETAGADGFITQLPEGYNSMLGERGFGLSGGQAQRIALARALLSDRPILLLDEPTASLDADTEAAFLTALKQAAEGRTVILATHSERAAAIADTVVRLDNGRAVL